MMMSQGSRTTGKAMGRLLIGVLLLCPLISFGQYQVFYWENFENGVLPDSLQMKFTAGTETVGVLGYASPYMPPGITEGIAPTECGKSGLVFQTKPPEARFLAVVNDLMLDRGLLGEKGRALYQADFYIPPDGAPVASFAILAVNKDVQNQRSLWQMYRFGVLNGNKLYFSYADNRKKQGTPVMTKTQGLDELEITRPGWHRLQIVFVGQEQIICAVDGKATNFSPFVEPSLTELQAGIMVTSPEDAVQMCFADNLSIQWTKEDIPLPISPWVGGESLEGMNTVVAQPARATPGAATTMVPAGGGAASASPSRVEWQVSPDIAWRLSMSQHRPILVMFFTPDARTYPLLKNILMTDPSAQQLLSKFVCLGVDANQLRGGALAQQFSVFRVPTFVAIGQDGQVKAKVTFEEGMAWNQVAQQIQAAVSP